jgi:hypothetical protein
MGRITVMPYYTFYDDLEQTYFTKSMSISEMEKFLESNTHVKWVPVSGLPTLDSVRLGIRKPEEGFRDVLRTVKKANPGSKVNTF